MGLWPKRAAQISAAVRVEASETFPDASKVFYTQGAQVPISNIFETKIPRDVAMSVPAVQRGVTLLSTTAAGIPFERIDAQGKRVDLGWIGQPEPGRPRYNTFTDIYQDLILDGASYLRVHERAANGAPAFGGCEHIEISRIDYFRDHQNIVQVTIDGREVSRKDIIGFDGPHKGICTVGARTIKTALALEAASARYADTPMPQMTLANVSGYELSDAEIDTLIGNWQKARNNSGIGYTNAGIEAKAIGFNARELQLVEGRQFMATQIANLVGISPHYIAGAAASSGGTVTYANVTQDARGLIDYGLKPLLNPVEARLSLSDVNGDTQSNKGANTSHQVRAQLDQLLRGDALARAQVYAILVPLGIMTADEAREAEDLTPQGRVNQ